MPPVSRGSRPLFQSTPTNFMAGDRTRSWQPARMERFQSTPTNFMAGDAEVCHDRVSARHRFQSTPTNFMAGDPADWRDCGTRSPFQSTPTNFMAGDPFRSWFIPNQQMFQSTPTNFMAGDPPIQRGATACCGFNPRPPISWRATASFGRVILDDARFNPRPPISWRATRGLWSCPPARPVSIHAHQFHGGRQDRTEHAERTNYCFNPRPPISWRATPEQLGKRRTWRSFNPRPPISWRATRNTNADARLNIVSIHAHQFHGGRLTSRARGNKRP